MKFGDGGNPMIFIPDEAAPEQAMARTTSLCIAAHQDDVELMAGSAIADCFGDGGSWFSACVVTDGAGSPRANEYSDCSDEDMKRVRRKEQNKAAVIGEYGVQIQLGYPSAQLQMRAADVIGGIAGVLRACSPEIVYTHNLADRHGSHVAVALHVISAIRTLPEEKRPKKLYGMEVWRSLDWLTDGDKLVFDASKHANILSALIGVFDSQITGGKRYDLAVQKRRTANATFLESGEVDAMSQAIYAMDMTQLMCGAVSPSAFIEQRIENFKRDVMGRLAQYSA